MSHREAQEGRPLACVQLDVGATRALGLGFEVGECTVLVVVHACSLIFRDEYGGAFRPRRGVAAASKDSVQRITGPRGLRSICRCCSWRASSEPVLPPCYATESQAAERAYRSSSLSCADGPVLDRAEPCAGLICGSSCRLSSRPSRPHPAPSFPAPLRASSSPPSHRPPTSHTSRPSPSRQPRPS